MCHTLGDNWVFGWQGTVRRREGRNWREAAVRGLELLRACNTWAQTPRQVCPSRWRRHRERILQALPRNVGSRGSPIARPRMNLSFFARFDHVFFLLFSFFLLFHVLQTYHHNLDTHHEATLSTHTSGQLSGHTHWLHKCSYHLDTSQPSDEKTAHSRPSVHGCGAG